MEYSAHNFAARSVSAPPAPRIEHQQNSALFLPLLGLLLNNAPRAMATPARTQEVRPRPRHCRNAQDAPTPVQKPWRWAQSNQSRLTARQLMNVQPRCTRLGQRGSPQRARRTGVCCVSRAHGATPRAPRHRQGCWPQSGCSDACKTVHPPLTPPPTLRSQLPYALAVSACL